MYSDSVSNVFVFKTNIHDDEDLNVVTSIVNAETQITKWNIDREDIDKVLRIEALDFDPQKIISLLNKAGFECEELQD